jgi:hypothetical protein
MGRFRARRPSPALFISIIALFVALGGSGYAAVKINGKNVKNRSIAGTKLKNRTISGAKVKKDTLTGTELNESKLGKVPNAIKADSATTAGSAGTASSATTAGSATSAASAGTAAAAGQVFHAEDLNEDSLNTGTTNQDEVLALTVPAGNYLILGGGYLNNGGLAARRLCRLSTGGAFDEKLVGVGDDATNNDASAFALQITAKLAASTPLSLSCSGGAQAMTVGGRSIVAYRVASVSP